MVEPKHQGSPMLAETIQVGGTLTLVLVILLIVYLVRRL